MLVKLENYQAKFMAALTIMKMNLKQLGIIS